MAMEYKRHWPDHAGYVLDVAGGKVTGRWIFSTIVIGTLKIRLVSSDRAEEA
jgi:hypothetical protein